MRRLLTMLLLTVAAGFASAPVQVGPNNCAVHPAAQPGSGTLTCTFSSSVGSGNIMVIGIGARLGTATGIATVTDTLGTSYASLGAGSFISASSGAWLYAGKTTTGGSNTVTVTFSGGTGQTFYAGWLMIAEYPGTDLVETAAGTMGQSGGLVNHPTCGAFTPTEGNTQIIAMLYVNQINAVTLTTDSPMTRRQYGYDTSDRMALLQDYFMTSAVSINPGAVQGGAGTALYSCFAAALKSAAAAPAPTLSTIAPTTGVAGTAVAVTLTGTNLNGATSISAAAGITVSALTVVNSTTVTATFTIDPGTTAGAGNVTITTPGGTSGAVTFTVIAPTPDHVQYSAECHFAPGSPGSGGMTCAFPGDVTIGNVIAVGIGARFGAATGMASVTDSRGTTFTLKISDANATTGAYIYTGIASSSGPDTVTVTLNGTYYFGHVGLGEYQYLTENVNGAMHQTGSGTGGVAHGCGTAFTPTKTNTMAIAFTYENGGGFTGFTVASPFTSRVKFADGSSVYRNAMMADSWFATAASVNPQFTDAVTGAYSCVAVALESVISVGPGARRRQSPEMSLVIGGPTDGGPTLDFSLVWLSDSHPDASGYAERQNVDYVLARTTAWNIKGFMFTGDVRPATTGVGLTSVQQFGTYGWNDIISSGLPAIAAEGNHDCDAQNCPLRTSQLSSSEWDQYAGYQTIAAKSYGPVTAFSGIGNDKGSWVDPFGSRANHAIRFAVNGHKFLVISLELYPRTEPMLWANNLALVYPDHEIIWITHGYIAPDGNPCTGATVGCAQWGPPGNGYHELPTTGKDLHDNLISQLPNSFIALAGHFADGTYWAKYESTASTGKKMYGFFANYQNALVAPNDLIMRLQFHEATKTFDLIGLRTTTEAVQFSYMGLDWPQ